MKRVAGRAVLVVLLGAPFPARVSGQEAGFDAQRAAARSELVKELEGFAAWCQEKSLFLSKQRACEILLELDPDHAEARKSLGHARAKDGTWKAPEKPKAFRDFDKQALAEVPGRWRAATEGYVTSMVGLLEAGALSAGEREVAAREALRVDPDNERVHVLAGEVKDDGGWVLRETQRARARRAELRDAVRAALEDAPTVAPAELDESERKIPLKLAAYAAPGLRVVGTTGEHELRLAAQAVLALESFLQFVFESTHALPEDCTVFLLASPAELPVFVANHPAVPADERARYEHLEGSGIQGTDAFAFWTGDTQRRIDGIVRLVLGFWLSGAYEIDVRHGWVYEGFGLFLTRALVRSRMTWLAPPSKAEGAKADMALRQRLLAPEANWMDEGLRLLVEKRQPPLEGLFRKDAGQLSTEDVLYSYVLATYLLEARPEVAGKVLARLGAGYPGISALREALELDPATFERHLQRWLKERV
jgi:hypothetical protein